ncbi:MAG: DNA-binding protein [Oscillospiraceae bacterium]|nr:DNA-binding protein [Oscillospiraceae bacterium]
MEYRRFGDTVVVRMDKNEEIIEQIRRIAEKEQIKLASVQALGAVDDFTVGVFNTTTKEYRANEFKGAFEIVSLTGTISTMDGEFYCHLHMSAGDSSGAVFGGHLNRANISATCEMIINVIPGQVDRKFSEEIGLNLFSFDRN